MAKWKYDAQMIDRKLAAAAERARLADAIEPRAVSARYDRNHQRIVVELTTGATVSIPARLCQGLAGAPAEEISKVEITPARDGLHWESLDVDLGLPELIGGIYGTREWMSQLRRLGVQAKARAKPNARANGLKKVGISSASRTKSTGMRRRSPS